MQRIGLITAMLVLLVASPAIAQLTAHELDGFGDLPTQSITGKQIQTLWLRGFIAGLKTAAEITDAGRVKTVVDTVWECIADYSYETILSLFRDWLRVNKEWAENPARDALFVALMQHCAG